MLPEVPALWRVDARVVDEREIPIDWQQYYVVEWMGICLGFRS